MNENERKFQDRLSAIDALLDTIVDALPENYIISIGEIKYRNLRIMMKIDGYNQAIVKHIPIDPGMKWDYEREVIKYCVIESFTILNNNWLKTKLNNITTEEIELYIV